MASVSLVVANMKVKVGTQAIKACISVDCRPHPPWHAEDTRSWSMDNGKEENGAFSFFGKWKVNKIIGRSTYLQKW